MRVCLILEGCYPYVRGGVSAWTHQFISRSSQIEFVLWTIHADRADMKEKYYAFPPNVVEHHTVILHDAFASSGRPVRKPENISSALQAVLFQEKDALEHLMQTVAENPGSAYSIGRHESFVDVAKHLSESIPGLGVADAYYQLRSMLLPLVHLLQIEPPEADLYHAAVTGYGGMIGALAAYKTRKPFLLTEHGIYPREREEELLTADWLHPALRDFWIDFFYGLSRFAYMHAARVTSLFPDALRRQVQIGCPPEKCRVIPNGIELEPFLGMDIADASMPSHIGALIRFAAIKDLKTMIRAFAIVRQQIPGAVLHLMGGTDDESYRLACVRLAESLHLQEAIRFEGHVSAAEYLPQMRFTVLSSISEGQPLAILESMASGRPVISTRVGNCPDLILSGKPAGLVVPPMRPDLLAQAMISLCRPDAPIRDMGLAGREKVRQHHDLPDMLHAYHELYREVLTDGGHRI